MTLPLLSKIVSDVFADYQLNPNLLDEVFAEDGQVNPHYQEVLDQFTQYSAHDFIELNEHAKLSFFNQG